MATAHAIAGCGIPKRRRIKTILCDFALITACFCIAYAPCIFEGALLSPLMPDTFSDTLNLTLPSFTFTGQSLANGILPLWNPFMYCGYPHLAMGFTGVFYPATYLYAKFSFPHAYAIDTLTHLYFHALCWCVVGRSLFQNRAAVLIMAIIGMTSPTLNAAVQAGHIETVRFVSWTPLAMLCLFQVLSSGRLVWVWGLGLIGGIQALVGDPQHLVYQVLAFATLALAVLGFQAARDPKRFKPSVGRAFKAVAALAITALVGAVQLIPARELMSQSIRSAGVALEYIAPFGPISPQLFSFNSFQQPGHHLIALQPIALGLAAAAIFLRGPWMRWVFLILAIFCVAFSVWPETPFAEYILQLPLIGQGRVPQRMLLFYGMALAILAGYGADNLFGKHRASRLSCLAFLIAVFLLCGHSWLIDHHAGAKAVGLSALAALAAGSTILVPRWKSLALGLVVVGVAMEALLTINSRFTQGAPEQYQLSKPYLAFHEAKQNLDRVLILSRSPFSETVAPSAGMLTGDRMITGAHSLLLDSYARWLDTLAPRLALIQRNPDGLHAGEQYWNLISNGWLDNSSIRVLDLLGVRYVWSPEPDPDFISFKTAQGSPRFKVMDDPRFKAYENLSSLPTAYVVHNVDIASSLTEATAMLARPDYPYRERAVVTGSLDTGVLSGQDGNGHVIVTRYGANDVTLEAQLESPGLLILTDVDYPGWQVTVDGHSRRMVKANGILRGVVLPAGRSRVIFSYTPLSFTCGYFISIAALGCTCLGVVACARRNRRYDHALRSRKQMTDERTA